MQVFVTGGSGFVGRHLISALVDRGDKVRALARSDEAAEKVKEAGAKPVRGDLDDVEAMRDGMKGCELLFHAAAKLGLWGDPQEFHRVNVTGTKNVIEAAKEAGVRRFVHVSTEAVLVGADSLARVNELTPMPARQIGLYPRTKALAEHAVLEADSENMRTVAVRAPLIWGKGDTSVLPQIVEAVRTGRFMWINGGHYPRSTCHVRNVVEGLLCAAEKGKGGEVYYVTDGEAMEFRAFLTKLMETQGIELPNRNVPLWAASLFAMACDALWTLFPLKGEPPLSTWVLHVMGAEVTCRDDKARAELGYVGRVGFEEGFEAMREAR